jgi:tRNA(fMet)-specific endonuclease VapC
MLRVLQPGLKFLPYDNGAAAHTGQLRAELKKIGRPISPYDEMIAGHARSQGLVVVTNNTKQFENVPGIRLTNWVG